MKKPSRKHHFVPASLLRYFSIGGRGAQVHVFDKRTGKSFTPAVENAGSENNFNKVQLSSGELNFEPLFDDIDRALDGLLREVYASKSVHDMSEVERVGWADVIAAQMLRTPLARHTHVQTAKDLADSLVQAGFAAPAFIELPTDNDTRRMTVQSVLARAPLRAVLVEKDLVLYEPAGVQRFWISDYPVVVESTVPYGDGGIASPGVAVYFPLGPNLMLGLWCKSIGRSLNARPLERLHLDSADIAQFVALREGLKTGAPIQCSDEQVAAFNRRQVARSRRFIYTSEDVAAMIRPMLERNPDLREVSTHARFGRMGEGPPADSRMPEGRWLVLFGRHNHYMIRIANWNEGYPMEVLVEDIDTMNRALADGPFSEMRLYENNVIRRGMRHIRIDVLATESPVRVSIRHSDPGLDVLDERIRRGASVGECS